MKNKNQTTSDRHKISDENWNRIKDFFPCENTGKGRPSKPNQDMFNAILWIAETGCPWRDLPERFGSWKTVYTRFSQWSKAGVFQKIFDHQSRDKDMQEISIDSTSCKVHPHAVGAKKIQKILKITNISVYQKAGKTQKSMQ